MAAMRTVPKLPHSMRLSLMARGSFNPDGASCIAAARHKFTTRARGGKGP